VQQLIYTPPRTSSGQSTFDALADTAYVRLSDIVPSVVPIGRATWWRWVAAGRAPAPVKLSPGVSAWRVSDVRSFLATTGRTRGGH
jgi:predicted DNA-binding transcriptional regulator AlpA